MFSSLELERFDSKMRALMLGLAQLEVGLDTSEQSDEQLDQALAEVNERIFELRRHWREMLQLPPPKGPIAGPSK